MLVRALEPLTLACSKPSFWSRPAFYFYELCYYYFMTLYINTSQNNLIEIAIKNKNKFIFKKRFSSYRTQAEKLLPAIEKIFKNNKLKLSDLKKIEVANSAGSFTSLRIGVVTANALGYALGIAVFGTKGESKVRRDGVNTGFNMVEPLYSSEPVITAKKCG
jgi:hypothetical protein